MTPLDTPQVRDVVLLGGGHAHVQVLKRFGMRPAPGVRLSIVAREPHSPYSGMLPGYVAGHYDWGDIHIDLARLAAFAGARFIAAEATGLDLPAQHIAFDDRPPLRQFEHPGPFRLVGMAAFDLTRQESPWQLDLFEDALATAWKRPSTPSASASAAAS